MVAPVIRVAGKMFEVVIRRSTVRAMFEVVGCNLQGRVHHDMYFC